MSAPCGHHAYLGWISELRAMTKLGMWMRERSPPQEWQKPPLEMRDRDMGKTPSHKEYVMDEEKQQKEVLSEETRSTKDQSEDPPIS